MLLTNYNIIAATQQVVGIIQQREHTLVNEHFRVKIIRLAHRFRDLLQTFLEECDPSK